MPIARAARHFEICVRAHELFLTLLLVSVNNKISIEKSNAQHRSFCHQEFIARSGGATNRLSEARWFRRCPVDTGGCGEQEALNKISERLTRS